MPPSIDSTCTQSACVTLSTPRKRNSKIRADEEDVRKKKSRVQHSSSLSETSPPRRLDNLGTPAGQQLTQESQKNQPSPDIDHPYVHVDQQQEYVSMGQNAFLNRPKFGLKESDERRRASQDLDGPVRSMILHSAGVARTLLAAYEKERDQTNRNGSAMMTELTQLRTFSDAAAAELPLLRTFREAATVELARLRVSNEVAAAEVANLQMENAQLVKMEASASSRLDALQRQWTTGEAVNIVAAFVISKALMLREVEDLRDTVSSEEIEQLRVENGRLSKDIAEMNESWRSQMLKLQASLAVADIEVTELRAVKVELTREKLDREASVHSAADELLGRLAAANDEVQRLQSKAEALEREKAAALEREKMESHSEALLGEMQTAMETTRREMEKMHSTLESKTATLREVFLEKEDIAREKAASDARAKMNIAELLSEKAALVAEMEKASATAAREFKRLSSRLEATLGSLQTLRRETGLVKTNLEAKMAAKYLELEGLKKKMAKMQADMAARNARGAQEIHHLRREQEEGQAREAALQEKLSSLPRTAHSQMHLAFLINCGLLRAEEHSFGFEQGCS